MIFTLLYNLPKFFELYIKEDLLTKVVNCEEIESEPNLYSTYLKNCTEADSMTNITIPDLGRGKISYNNIRLGDLSKCKTELKENKSFAIGKICDI